MWQLFKRKAPEIDVSLIQAPQDSISDESVIELIRQGDVNAYGRLMRRHNQRLFRIARGFVTDDAAAMDIVQEAHIKAFFKLDDYRGDGRFVVWLASITRNEALMYLRKHKREVVMSDEEIRLVEATVEELNQTSEEMPEMKLENDQLQQLIQQHLDKIPGEFRSVFVCRAIEQFNVRETAEILGLREETVKTRYFRARRLLRDQMQRWLDNSGLKMYEVGGKHCDALVYNVLTRIHAELQ